MAEVIAAGTGRPGCRRLGGFGALTIHRDAADTSAGQALAAHGLAGPGTPGPFAGACTDADPLIAWRSPHEWLMLSLQPARCAPVLAALAAGRSATAFAAELSDALVLYELHGPQLDAWLSRLVDAQAVPRTAGGASPCRLADVSVLLLRLQADRLWLAADRTLAPYLDEWLAYAHAGAFPAAA
jgi:sarcosine oxidase gamma subunit